MSLWSLHFYKDTNVQLGCTTQLTLSRVSESTVVPPLVSPVVTTLVWSSDGSNRIMEVSISERGKASSTIVLCLSKDRNRVNVELAPMYFNKLYDVKLIPSSTGILSAETTLNGLPLSTLHCSYEFTSDGLHIGAFVIGTVANVGAKSML